ncbi:hypothetical protein V1264_020335 [Littorina saxatilis]|uniref:Uncharacterized protein n=1 Tax=Littorina saxatilis TaxID=31220 RepID=A0AAN9GAR5_9CAEN
MPSWIKPPTVEAVLLISGAVGGFWCIFVCLCQIVRRAAQTARKNTVIYRGDSTRHSARHRGNFQNVDNSSLHHGVTPVQESHPLRPLFMPSRVPGENFSAAHAPLRSTNSNRNMQRGASIESREAGSRITSPVNTVVFPDYVERVILPEYVERVRSPFGDEQEYVPGIDSDEEPPPYDAVDEHMDYAPPAYTDIFPDKT